MYEGEIWDVFFHPPWAPENQSEGWGTRSEWIDDPMRQRVMRTFHQQNASEARTPDKTIDDMLEDMEASRVTRAVLQASAYYSGTNEDELRQRNAEVGKLKSEHPRRFQAVGTVMPPDQGPASYWDLMRNPRLLEEAAEQHGIVGVHLLPSPWGTPPDDKWYYPLYATCVELELVVFSYVGMPGPLWPMYPNYPLHLDSVALAFPELKLVAHHIGDPWVAMMTHLAGKHENLYITTSAWSPKRYPADLLDFMRTGWHGTSGAEKVLFGTDYPLLDLQKATGDARRLELPEDVLAKFLWGNAQKLFDA